MIDMATNDKAQGDGGKMPPRQPVKNVKAGGKIPTGGSKGK